MLGLVEGDPGVRAGTLREQALLDRQALGVVAPRGTGEAGRFLDLAQLDQRVGRRRVSDLRSKRLDRGGILAAPGAQGGEAAERPEYSGSIARAPL